MELKVSGGHPQRTLYPANFKLNTVWQIANRGAYSRGLGGRELPLAIVMLALCRNPDFFLRASQPEPPASSSFSRSFPKYAAGLTTVEY